MINTKYLVLAIASFVNSVLVGHGLTIAFLFFAYYFGYLEHGINQAVWLTAIVLAKMIALQCFCISMQRTIMKSEKRRC